ncbi:MCE family protein [Mycobacterium sp. 1274756.6]|uniref:MCE family protein n=1 Tax=Mycobacterium sp. 1274756.6 TaxID=1834076 RepID=UPI0007FE415D|nr:MCE family protein [Mycobacterium sp. 1274756.6]OBJ67829.1 mammalian cell entry protein [Mycobacterium sp. 1274756.6]
MGESFSRTLWRFGIYAAVCLSLVALVFMVFGNIRFEKSKTYAADFINGSGLTGGDFVRIAGVEVGKIQDVSVQPDATVRVAFSVDDSVVLTEGTRAVIRYDDLIGGRYMVLEEGVGSVSRLRAGDTIPLSRTQSALDLDALIGGFQPLFRALDPDQINTLSSALITAFQGQGGAISSVLAQTASLTDTLADRDHLIGEFVTNLNVLLASMGDQGDQLATTVDSLSDLVEGLEARKQDISNGVAYADAAASSIASLLADIREPVKKVVHETDRTAALVLAEHEYFDDLLNTLPDAYRILGRQGLYGGYFSFYLCDAVLKMNGKGGQPVYVKVAGQDTGRCAPR